MTNITPEQRLALARAVYPEHDWRSDECGVWMDCCDGAFFQPESNPAKLLDVLCWLLKQDDSNGVCPDHVRYYLRNRDYFTGAEHNCTPASLSDAIVRAAVRVREGE